MLQSIGSCDRLELLMAELSEWPARASEQDFRDFIICITDYTLEDCTVFAVDRQDRYMVFFGQTANQFACNNKRFLVCQAYLLMGFNGIDGWNKPRKANHGSQNHVDRFGRNNLFQGLLAGIDLDIRFVTEQFLQRFIMGLIAYNDCCRLEFTCLLSQFLYTVVGCKTIDLVAITVLSNDIEGLRADTSGRTEDAYLLFFLFHFYHLGVISRANHRELTF